MVRNSVTKSRRRFRAAALGVAAAAFVAMVNPGAAGARAAAISGLYRLGEAEMRELIRVRMLDEADPLVKRTFEWEESRADELSR